LTILFEKYHFIQDGCYLGAWVDSETGKQRLVMQYIENETVLVEDIVDCIHPVVYVSNQNLNNIQNVQEFNIDSVDSTELMEVKLDPNEKFLQLKSWIAGIVELGDNCFKIQDEIEHIGNLQYPLSSRLLMFLSHVDPRYMQKYIAKIDQECMYEDKRHEPSLIANLQNILQMFIYASEERLHEFQPSYKIDHFRMLSLVFELHPPLRLFTDTVEFISFLEHPYAVKIENFEKGFTHPDPAVRLAIAKNPNAPKLKGYRKFLSPYLEPNETIRKIAVEKMNTLKKNSEL
jgi:hypothetical protein